MERLKTILHKGTALVLLVAIAGSTFSKGIALLDYKLNEKYIAANLCENRNRPDCCCHGKCFLKKQLQKDEEPAKNNFPFLKDKYDVSLFFEHAQSVGPGDFGKESLFIDHYLFKRISGVVSPVFRPPLIA